MVDARTVDRRRASGRPGMAMRTNATIRFVRETGST